LWSIFLRLHPRFLVLTCIVYTWIIPIHSCVFYRMNENTTAYAVLLGRYYSIILKSKYTCLLDVVADDCESWWWQNVYIYIYKFCSFPKSSTLITFTDYGMVTGLLCFLFVSKHNFGNLSEASTMNENCGRCNEITRRINSIVKVYTGDFAIFYSCFFLKMFRHTSNENFWILLCTGLLLLLFYFQSKVNHGENY